MIRKIILISLIGTSSAFSQVAVQTITGTTPTLSRPNSTDFYHANPPPASSLTLNIGANASGILSFSSGTLNLTNATNGASGLALLNSSGALTIGGALSFSDLNIGSSFVGNVNNYYQLIAQNQNSGSSASTDFIVNNNLGTSTTFYGDFGINSSGFTGSSLFNTPSATYLTATSGSLIIGTTTSNDILFATNSGTIPALKITSTGTVSIPGSLNATGTSITLVTPLSILNPNSAIIVIAESIGTGFPYVALNPSAPLKPVAFPTPTGTTTNASTVITGLSGTASIVGGNVMTITGTGIPANTTVVSVATASGTSTLTLSTTATLSHAASTFTIGANGKGYVQWLSLLNPGIPVYNYSCAGADSGAYFNILTGATGSTNNSFVGGTEYLNGVAVTGYCAVSSNPVTIANAITAAGGVPYFVLGMDGNNDAAGGGSVSTFTTQTSSAISYIRANVTNPKIVGMTSQLAPTRTPSVIDPYNGATRLLWLTGSLDGLADVTPALIHYQNTNFYYTDQTHPVSGGHSAYAKIIQNAIIGNSIIPNLSSLFVTLDDANTFTAINTFNSTDTFFTSIGASTETIHVKQPSGDDWQLTSNSSGQFALISNNQSNAPFLINSAGTVVFQVRSGQSFLDYGAGTVARLTVQASSGGNGWTLTSNSDSSMSLAGISGLTTESVSAAGNVVFTVPSGGSFAIGSAASFCNFQIIDAAGSWFFQGGAGNALSVFGVAGLTTMTFSNTGNVTFQIPNSSGSFNVTTGSGTSVISATSTGTLSATGSITQGGNIVSNQPLMSLNTTGTIIFTNSGVDQTIYDTSTLLASGTITLSSTSTSGQIERYVSANGITTVTVLGTVIVGNSITTLTANSSVGWQSTASGTWIRIQ